MDSRLITRLTIEDHSVVVMQLPGNWKAVVGDIELELWEEESQGWVLSWRRSSAGKFEGGRGKEFESKPTFEQFCDASVAMIKSLLHS
ncbi:MAG TPA: hypothetical protein VK171_16270 [Fimbriimonas sp.]|nr:hypothetical protein [Fimbriimonas sp.]